MIPKSKAYMNKSKNFVLFCTETTTDYPFVVSDGPKANIHPLRNSKIKMGNDHDEDLVDYYDDDEDSDDSPSLAPLTDDDASDEGIHQAYIHTTFYKRRFSRIAGLIFDQLTFISNHRG